MAKSKLVEANEKIAEGESVEEAKARMAAEQKAREEKSAAEREERKQKQEEIAEAHKQKAEARGKAGLES